MWAQLFATVFETLKFNLTEFKGDVVKNAHIWNGDNFDFYEEGTVYIIT